MESLKALDGVRVLELGMYGAAPLCCMQLADFGADVIKVEPPHGDFYRQLPPLEDGESHYFMSVNRNKRSVVLDLKTETGRAALRRLIATADVVVENFRPGVLEKLGFSYEDCRAVQPNLIYCAISGFGQTGPQRLEAGQDLIVQGYTGMMWCSGEEGQIPLKLAPAVPDVMAGQSAAYAIAMALFVRERTGVGQFIDIALYDTSIQAMQLSYLARYLGDGTLPGRHGSGHPSMVPAQAFQAGDGAWFNVVANTDAMWAGLCQALQDPELARDPRFAERGARAEHAASVLALLEARFATQPRAVWLERFKAVGLPCGPVNHLDELVDAPQTAARAMIVEHPHPRLGPLRTVGIAPKLSATPGRISRHAPALGEHTEEVLREAGLAVFS